MNTTTLNVHFALSNEAVDGELTLEDFREALTWFVENSKYRRFCLQKVIVYHIDYERTNSQSDFVYMYEISEEALQSLADFKPTKFKMARLSKSILPKEILERIAISPNETSSRKAERISTVLKLFPIAAREEQIVCFLDDRGRSTIITKLDIKGEILNAKDGLADIVIARAMLFANKRTKETIGGEVVDVKKDAIYYATIRSDKNANVLVGVFSKPFNWEEFYALPEWENKDLMPYYYKLTNSRILVEFKGRVRNGIIPIVRYVSSDTGYSKPKYQLLAKKQDAKNPNAALIFDDVEDVAIALEEFNKLADVAFDDALVYEAKKIDSKIKTVALALGKKRWNTYKEKYFSADRMSQAEFLHNALEMLDNIGSINQTADDNISKGVGNLFLN